jgi:N-acetylglucosaminyl-diphospho-decaprenol L-rhamnosyltransferase
MEPGVVVITHNSAEVLPACLAAAAGRCGDLVVIDNGSTDGTADIARARGARVVVNEENRGFAAAANQGLALLDCEFVLLLNPDAVLETPLEPLVRACSAPGVGAAGGKLAGDDGLPQRGFTLRRFPGAAELASEALLLNRVWPSNPVNRRYRCLDADLEQAQEAEQPAGAFLLIRREAWRQVGGFDESFFPVWFEDVDFCYRLRQAGWRIRYEPGAVARHQGGHAVLRMPWEERQAAWYGSLLRYAQKHLGPQQVRMLGFAILVGVLLRVWPAVVAERSFRPLRSCGRVLRLAGSSFCRGF